MNIESINEISYESLDKIRSSIEAMNQNHHVEIGKIFKRNNVKLTENNNGIFVNLSNVKENVLDEINDYVNFVKNQEQLISLDEAKKEDIELTYFTNVSKE